MKLTITDINIINDFEAIVTYKVTDNDKIITQASFNTRWVNGEDAIIAAMMEQVDFYIGAKNSVPDMSKHIGTTYDLDKLYNWTYIRSKRNALLRMSDWTQLPDVNLSEATKLAWKEYRQALRNIPQNYSTPQVIVWPTPPA